MSEANNTSPRSKMYQYSAGLQESTGEIIYSRAHHDFRKTKDEAGFVDGGMDYFRASGVKHIIIELTVDPASVYDDWNYRKDKYGVARTYTNSGMLIEAPEFIRIVPPEEYEDKTAFEYKKKYITWGTYGPKGDQPRRTVMLQNADTEHLKAILSTQIHIGKETADIIRSILKDRGIEC